MTLASESCSRALVEAECLPVLLEQMEQTNHSQPALLVLASIVRVLSNIARVLRERGEGREERGVRGETRNWFSFTNFHNAVPVGYVLVIHTFFKQSLHEPHFQRKSILVSGLVWGDLWK